MRYLKPRFQAIHPIKPMPPSSIRTAILMLCLLLLQGCAVDPARLDISRADEQRRIADLEQAILSLGDDIDPEEASRAARVAIDYSLQLAREYEVSGSPIFHNVMVNLGLRSRGLCVHWTRDLRDRLRQEDFRSLDLHWAIANYESLFRLEHSTVVVSARGAGLQQGLVLDPWRNSGELYWARTLDDSDYNWRPQAEILALKEQRADARPSRGVLH
jgi:hypothetical protein